MSCCQKIETVKGIARAVGTILGSQKISQEEIEHRRQICSDCHWSKVRDKKCHLCGCFIELKIRDPQASCPDQQVVRWLPVSPLS